MTAYTNDSENVQPADTAEHPLANLVSHLFPHRLEAKKPTPHVSAANGPVTDKPNFDSDFWTPQYPAQYMMPDTHHDQAPLGDHKKNEIPYRGKDHGIQSQVLESDYAPAPHIDEHNPFIPDEPTYDTIDLVTNPVPVRIVNEQQPIETSSRITTNAYVIAGSAAPPYTTQQLTGRKANRTRFVIVTATGTSFAIGGHAEGLASGVQGILIPPMTVFEVFTTEPIYCANVAAGSGRITIMEEYVVDNTKKVD